MKAIVIYYSKSGKTEAAAKKIQEEFCADILKLEAKDPYGGFLSSVMRARKERKLHLPSEVATEVPDLSAYDTVFFGFPIWMSTMPLFIREYMKKVNLRNKMLIPFGTSKKTSLISAMTDIKECCTGANIKEGLILQYNESTDFKKWADNIHKYYS